MVSAVPLVVTMYLATISAARRLRSDCSVACAACVSPVVFASCELAAASSTCSVSSCVCAAAACCPACTVCASIGAACICCASACTFDCNCTTSGLGGEVGLGLELPPGVGVASARADMPDSAARAQRHKRAEVGRR